MALETLIFSAISAAGQLQAGKAEQQEAELNRFNIQTDKKFNAVAAEQEALARKQEFDSAMDSNIASFYAMGRDVGSSMSIKAFLEKQKDTAFQDISRVQNQKHWQNIKADMASLAEGRRGRNARTASLYRATATLGQGISDYMKLK